MSNSFDWLFKNQVKDHKHKFNFDSKLADERIKHCESCNRCWEFDRFTSRNPHNRAKNKLFYNYYEDFPVYGKEKEICPKCKE